MNRTYFITVSKNILTTDIRNYPSITENMLYWNPKFQVFNISTNNTEIINLFGWKTDQTPTLSIEDERNFFCKKIINEFLKKFEIINPIVKEIDTELNFKKFNYEKFSFSSFPFKLLVINPKTKEHFFVNLVH